MLISKFLNKGIKKLLLLFLIIFGFILVIDVKAGNDENVSGWAWSENIGWVSFNNTSAGDSIDYGVRVCIDDTDSKSFCDTSFYQLSDPKKGKMLGYAWAGGGVDASGNSVATIGWIGFGDYDRDGFASSSDNIPSFPCYPNCKAEVDLDNCVGDICPISGWARALSFDSGWDGWIKLGPVIYLATNYGIRLNQAPTPDEFERWGWGTDAIGWLSFNCQNCANKPNCSCSNNPGDSPSCTNPPVAGACGDCGVGCFSSYRVTLTLNQPPEKPIPTTTWDYCSIQKLSIPIFQWTPYSDQDDVPLGTDPQTFTEIKIYGISGETILNETIPCLPGCSDNYRPSDGWITSNLLWGESYSWQVRVKDNNENWSEWSDPNSFDMPDHPAPWPMFAPPPSSEPTANEIVTFVQDGSDQYTNQSLCYSGEEDPCQDKLTLPTYSWDFGNGQSDDYVGNATTTYSDAGSYDVTLTITDDVGTCEITKTVTIGFSLPKWREVTPTF